MIFLPDETEKTGKIEQEPEDETDEMDGFTNPKQPNKQAERTAKMKRNVQNPKQEVAQNYLGIFQIFLVRPRLLIFLVVNYLLFWYKAGFPIVYNIYLATIYIIVIALSLSRIAEWIFRKFDGREGRHIWQSP